MTTPTDATTGSAAAIKLLNLHIQQFVQVAEIAKKTGHTVPSDTKSWSQILVTTLTGIQGLGRKKGADLIDGSDVKAANLWEAIDTPRFNGVLKTGRLSKTSRTPDDVTALDSVPYLFFVMWDSTPKENKPRCRIWVVRPKDDPLFRKLATAWYKSRAGGDTSNNFQLHPPRNVDHDRFVNGWGTLSYPLLFSAVYDKNLSSYLVETFNPAALNSGACSECEGDAFTALDTFTAQ